MVTMETGFEGHLRDIFGNDNLPLITDNTNLRSRSPKIFFSKKC